MIQPSPALEDLAFEDFRVGQRYASGVREISEQDLAAFTQVSGDASAIHSDVELAREAGFARPIGHGPLGVAVVFGLLYDSGIVEKTAIAMMDLDWRFKHPIFAGDAVHYEMTIMRCRRHRERAAGIVDRHFRLINQDGVVVQEGSSAFLVKARSDAPQDAHVRTDFGSREWAARLAPLLAEHHDFVAATETFDGALGFACGRESVQFRIYKSALIDVARTTPHGPAFTVSGSGLAWVGLAEAERNDYLARVTLGHFAVSGNMYEYLRMTKALVAAWDCIRDLAQLSATPA
jgi:acyl dehydratase